MRLLATLGIAAFPLLAAPAAAQAIDPRDAAHCSLALQAAFDVVKSTHGAASPLAVEMRRRMLWQGLAAARAERSAPDASLRRQLSADRHAALTTAEQCIIRQDAHPSFRAAALQQELLEAPADEPVSVLAGLDEIKRSVRSDGIAGAQD